MLFIKPSEISSKIMTLFDESDEFVVVVSPYIRISKWYKILKKINALKSRKIPIKFIVRDDSSNQSTFQDLNELGYDYTTFPDLHCKLYLNEKYAIVSSMNLLLSSEINSLEIAYVTQTHDEYHELVDFCKRYLNLNFDFNNITNNANINGDWRDYVCATLSDKYDGNIRTKKNDAGFEINANANKYSCFIWNDKTNRLRMSGILSSKEFAFLSSNPDYIPKIKELKIEFHNGGKGHYDEIWGTYEKPLKSLNISELHQFEQSDVSQKIIEFIILVNNFKTSDYYMQNKEKC